MLLSEVWRTGVADLWCVGLSMGYLACAGLLWSGSMIWGLGRSFGHRVSWTAWLTSRRL